MAQFFNTELTVQQFLDQYWQKKPLLIRQAFPAFEPLLTAEELAGLACDEDIESRLMIEDQTTAQWQLQHGPLSEDDFAQLPASHWTLLVQDVDKHIPACAELLKAFDFMPAWRRDDLMIIYAVEGGSVGAHVDSYDVFLLQAMGTREWQVGDKPLLSPELQEDTEVRLLAEFEPAETWILAPGDMLYLPPHFAHHGIAVSEGMTYSVGFRAPSQLEVMDELIHALSEQGLGEARYTDPDAALPQYQDELDSAAVQRFKQSLIELIDGADEAWMTALSRVLTKTKPNLAELAEQHFSEPMTSSEILSALNSGRVLIRNPYLRFVWWQSETEIYFSFDGEIVTESVALLPAIEKLEQCETIDMSALSWLNADSKYVALLQIVLTHGAWCWIENDSDG